MQSTNRETEPKEAGSRQGRAVWSFLTPRSATTTPRDEELLPEGWGMFLCCGMATNAWGDGSTVMLVHGRESRGTHWRGFIAGLVGAGFRAVAVDAPAHGGSPGERTNVLDYALRLVDARREIEPMVGVVGHSFGAGAGALAIALDRGLSADRVVLISGPASLVSVVHRWGRGYGLTEEASSA